MLIGTVAEPFACKITVSAERLWYQAIFVFQTLKSHSLTAHIAGSLVPLLL
jgi:hypothetical protein